MHARDGAHDGQAQAVAFAARRARLARAEEAVEDAGQVRRSTRAPAGEAEQVSTISPPRGVALMALEIRFASARRTNPALAATVASPAQRRCTPLSSSVAS
jgi:hypothetical protein